MLIEILFLLVLCIISVSDIKYRRIPNYLIIIMAIFGIISLFAEGFPQERIIGCIFPAIVLWAFKKRHHIGFGDIKLTIVIGLYYGYLQSSVILICALLLAACYGQFLKRIKHWEIKTVPLAPFVCVFCLLVSILRKIFF